MVLRHFIWSCIFFFTNRFRRHFSHHGGIAAGLLHRLRAIARRGRHGAGHQVTVATGQNEHQQQAHEIGAETATRRRPSCDGRIEPVGHKRDWVQPLVTHHRRRGRDGKSRCCEGLKGCALWEASSGGDVMHVVFLLGKNAFVKEMFPYFLKRFLFLFCLNGFRIQFIGSNALHLNYIDITAKESRRVCSACVACGTTTSNCIYIAAQRISFGRDR